MQARIRPSNMLPVGLDAYIARLAQYAKTVFKGRKAWQLKQPKNRGSITDT